MFFIKTLLVLASVSTTALGHVLAAPPLGVSGTASRSDVQNPSAARPCGRTALTAIDTSTTVPLNGDSFTVAATNFNGGRDGSTQFTVQVDSTGKGTAFKPATVTKNGVLAPARAGSAEITVQMPSGTTCTGGKTGNLCLVAFKSASGFGNCVVVSSGTAGAGAATGAGGVGGAGAGVAGVGTGVGASKPDSNAGKPGNGATRPGAGTGAGAAAKPFGGADRPFGSAAKAAGKHAAKPAGGAAKAVGGAAKPAAKPASKPAAKPPAGVARPGTATTNTGKKPIRNNRRHARDFLATFDEKYEHLKHSSAWMARDRV